jgi:hypothetical protein
MDENRAMLRHFLAAIAYRAQKSLRGAPEGYSKFRAARGARTPHEIVWHMTNVLGYARTLFTGGEWRPSRLECFEDEVRRLHETLDSLGGYLDRGEALLGTTPERLLQGPLSDAMTHVGQLALLRRLAGSPVPPENFLKATIDSDNLGPDQAEPASPDKEWPERE